MAARAGGCAGGLRTEEPVWDAVRGWGESCWVAAVPRMWWEGRPSSGGPGVCDEEFNGEELCGLKGERSEPLVKEGWETQVRLDRITGRSAPALAGSEFNAGSSNLA